MTHGTHDAIPDERNDDVLVLVAGELVPRAEAKISVFDSGYLVGDGIWEAVRLQDDVLVFLEDHLDRLWAGAATVGMELPWSRAALTEELWKVVSANDMHDGVHVRFMITRGIKRTPSQDPRLTVSGPTLVVIAEHKTPAPSSAAEGIRLFTSTIRRPPPDTLDPRLNCHSKLHEVMALLQAIEAGADEALMLDPEGFVATCNSTNFFIVTRGEIWTPSGGHLMNGITRAKVIEACRSEGMVVDTRTFSLFDVYGASEAFVTGTFGGITPVVAVDGRQIGSGRPGPVTDRVRDVYRAAVDRYVRERRDTR